MLLVRLYPWPLSRSLRGNYVLDISPISLDTTPRFGKTDTPRLPGSLAWLFDCRPHLRVSCFSCRHRKESCSPCPAPLYPLKPGLRRSKSSSPTRSATRCMLTLCRAELSRFVIGTESVLLLGAMGLIFSLAHRPNATATSASTRWDAPRPSPIPTLTTAPARAKCGRI